MGWLTERDKAAIVADLNITANAALTKIQAPGAADDYAQTTVGATIWTGTALCYLADTASDDTAGQRQVSTDQWLLTILDASGAPLPTPGARWAGSIVTVNDRRQSPAVDRTLRVTSVEHDDNDLLDSTVLHLEAL